MSFPWLWASIFSERESNINKFRFPRTPEQLTLSDGKGLAFDCKRSPWCAYVADSCFKSDIVDGLWVKRETAQLMKSQEETNIKVTWARSVTEFLLWFHSVSYISTRATVKSSSPFFQSGFNFCYLFIGWQCWRHSPPSSCPWSPEFLSLPLPVLDCFAGPWAPTAHCLASCSLHVFSCCLYARDPHLQLRPSSSVLHLLLHFTWIPWRCFTNSFPPLLNMFLLYSHPRQCSIQAGNARHH